MKTFYVFIPFIFFFSLTHAQWEVLNSPTQNRLWSVYFVNTSNGWAVGNNGTIIHTTDSGLTWEFQSGGTSNTLYSVCFSDTLKGWITGSGGLILNTTNGGIDWNSQNSGTVANLYWGCFIDSNRGWISGSSGVILHTTNGGNTWIEQISGTTTGLWEIFFVDSSNGWVVGGSVGIGYCLNTTDGGNTWNTQLNGISTWLYGIFFLDENIGWVSGNDANDIPTIFHTTNGGNTWTPQFSGVAAWWESIFFNDINNGWVVGSDGILYTTDGGTSWNNTNTPTGWLFSVFFTDSNHGWAVGEGGVIWRTFFVVPVELIDFKATQTGSKIFLQWKTASETNNWGFEIQRKFNYSDWEKLDFLQGHGTTNEVQEYSYVDYIMDGNQKSISYRLKQIDYDGSYDFSDEITLENNIPLTFKLYQNFPNPFNPSTKINYQIPIACSVKLNVYDVLGNDLITLVNGKKEAGTYEVEFSAANLTSGIYIYRLQAEEFISTKKMVFLR